MRKLASVQRVRELVPIAGADRIELARMDGNAWQCVVKKDDFRTGDLVCYCEIDSFVPVRPEFEFITSKGTKTLTDGSVGGRIKTVKLRGILSQGLLLPLTFPELAGKELAVGDDITELIGVKLYEPPVSASLAGCARGNFPSFVRKTNQSRIQGDPWMLEKYRDVLFEVTIKLDGSSGTFYLRDGEFGVCSRNLDLKDTEGNTFWRMARMYGLEARMRAVGRNAAVQGEVVGEGIQKNKDRIQGQRLFVFDVWDIDLGRHMTPVEREEYLDDLDASVEFKADEPEIDRVPALEPKQLFAFEDVDDVLKFAEGPGYNSGSREGVVFKSMGLVDGQVLSFKAISNRYLLREED